MLGDKNILRANKFGEIGPVGHKLVEKQTRRRKPQDALPSKVEIECCLHCSRTRCTGDCKDFDVARQSAPKRGVGPRGTPHEWNGKTYTARELGAMLGVTRQHINKLLRKGLTIDEIMDPNRPGYKKRRTEDGQG